MGHIMNYPQQPTEREQQQINEQQRAQWEQNIKCLKCGNVLRRCDIDSSSCREHIKDNNDLEVV